jgi:Helix-turn-helix domain
MPQNSTEVIRQKNYTVQEVAEFLRKSPDWVRREFRYYPGVIATSKPTRGKRPYVTLVIPESVLQRWIQEHRLLDLENSLYRSYQLGT